MSLLIVLLGSCDKGQGELSKGKGGEACQKIICTNVEFGNVV